MGGMPGEQEEEAPDWKDHAGEECDWSKIWKDGQWGAR